jgi:hypothetical protein
MAVIIPGIGVSGNDIKVQTDEARESAECVGCVRQVKYRFLTYIHPDLKTEITSNKTLAGNTETSFIFRIRRFSLSSQPTQDPGRALFS